MNTVAAEAQNGSETILLEDLKDRADFPGLPKESDVLRAVERVYGAKDGDDVFALIVHDSRSQQSTFIIGYADGRPVADLPAPLKQIVWEMLEGSRAHNKCSNLAISWKAGNDAITGQTLKESDPNVQAVRLLQKRASLKAGGLMGMARKAGSFLTFKTGRK